MFGYAYFRDYPYKIVTHARVFSIEYIKKELTVEEGLYIATQLKYLRSLYSYNNMANWNKVKELEIKLPVKNNSIDYNFMKNFIKALEKEALGLVAEGE